jgi:hypothetical protein
MMEGSGAGSVLVTNGSGCGSGRPKTNGPGCRSGSTNWIQLWSGLRWVLEYELVLTLLYPKVLGLSPETNAVKNLNILH